MRQDQRAPFLTALERARATAYPAGEYAGRESFIRAGMLHKAELSVIWRQECSSSHRAIATALLRCCRADSLQIAGQVGSQAAADLITAHQLWIYWLGSGRVRKFALVAE